MAAWHLKNFALHVLQADNRKMIVDKQEGRVFLAAGKMHPADLACMSDKQIEEAISAFLRSKQASEVQAMET